MKQLWLALTGFCRAPDQFLIQKNDNNAIGVWYRVRVSKSYLKGMMVNELVYKVSLKCM
jgi:hypothetical protein